MSTSSKTSWPLFRYLGKYFDNFILPTKRLIYLTATGGLIISTSFLFGIGFYVFWVYNALFIIFSLIDLLLLPNRQAITANRVLPEQVDVNETLTARVLLQNHSGQSFFFALKDDLPLTFTASTEIKEQLDGSEKTFTYKATPHERGKYTFSYLYLRYWGGIGLWKKQYKIPCKRQLKVLPDLADVRNYLSSPQETLVLDGKKIYKKQKQGSEFQQIREYVPDDDPRMINWSASARTQQLMTNIYQPEKGKRVTILIDCGRMMGVELAQQTKLDRSLEAALMLTAVALRQGDHVSVLAYSNQVKAYVPFGKGVNHFHTILEAVYDLKSDFVESNDQLAFHYVDRYQKKSSLMVLFSDMENYLYSQKLEPYLLKMRNRKTFLLLSLQDPLLYEWMHRDVKNSHIAHVKSIAYKFALDRKAYVQKMASRGIPVLDVPADRLPLAAVNVYLDVKSREAL